MGSHKLLGNAGSQSLIMAVISRKEFENGKVEKPSLLTEVLPIDQEEQTEKPRKKNPRPSSPWFKLQHPDFTASNRMSIKFDLDINDEKYSVEIIDGIVETQEIEVKNELCRRGYLFLNEEY